MVNALDACQPKLLAAYDRFPTLPLYLDSGAFQGNTDVGGYRKVIERIGERFVWVANLDSIGNAHTSNANYRALTHALPPHLADKVLWIYQGGCLKDLAAHAHERPIVGIGGVVPIIVDEGLDAAHTYVKRVGEVVQEAGSHAHLFGVGSPYLLQALNRETWMASVDTSKWLLGYKAQELLLASGQHCSATQLGLRLSRAECAANNIRVLREWISSDLSPQPMLSLWSNLDCTV